MLLPLLLSLAMVSGPAQSPLSGPTQNSLPGPAQASLTTSLQDTLPALHTLRDEDIASVTSLYEDQTLTVNMKNGAVYLYHHIDWDLEDKDPATPKRIRAAVKDLDDKVFTKTEHMPEFPGGDTAWQKYMDTFCKAHKDDISDAGTAVVTVQFVVHLKGQPTDIREAFGSKNSQQTALAIKAIRESPLWIPATQNGHLVVCYKLVKVSLQ